MPARRPSGPLVLSLVIHVAAGIALVNVVFHYDFSKLGESRPPAPVAERVTYVAVGQGGGAGDGATHAAPANPSAKAATSPRPLVAPVRVPDRIAPATAAPAVPAGGARRAGTGSEGATTGIVPGDPDSRLMVDPHQFFAVPKTHAQRVDSAVHAVISAYNDSVAKVAAAQGRKPGDWTFEKGGQKWGIDGSKIYLGKFAIPSAVLAALPLRIQGNPGETLNDRLVTTRRGEVLEHAASQFHDDEFKTAVKRIRERKDRERRERDAQRALAGSSPE